MLTSSHTALFLHDSDNNLLPLPGPVTAASSPTRSRRFTPPGSRTGPGRSRATRFPPDRVGPTRSTVAHSAQAHSGSVPGTPVRPGPTRITGGSSARADSDPSVQSRHLTSTTAALRTRKSFRPRQGVCCSRSNANGKTVRASDLKQAKRSTWPTTWHRGVRLKLYTTGWRRSYSRA